MCPRNGKWELRRSKQKIELKFEKLRHELLRICMDFRYKEKCESSFILLSTNLPRTDLKLPRLSHLLK